MDGRTDPLNDAALEQEIEALLSVQPSPEFVARVRSRVAEEPASGWRWRWPVAAVATTVAAVAIGVALWRPAETTTRSTSATPPTSAAPPASTAPAASTAPPRVAARTDNRRPVISPPRDVAIVAPLNRDVARIVAAPSRMIEISLPPVIIADNEIRAFATFVADRRATRFEFSSSIARAADDPIEVDKMPKVDPVTLEPIEIKPLVKVVELE